MSESISLAGTLSKRGNGGFSGYVWRYRFFVLERNILSYYEDEEAYRKNAQKGSIDLADTIHIGISPEASYGEGYLWSSGKYFQIECKFRKYFLYANSKQEASHWVETLNLSKQTFSPDSYPSETSLPLPTPMNPPEQEPLRNNSPEINFLSGTVKYYMFSEGALLKQYLEFFDSCTKTLAAESSSRSINWRVNELPDSSIENFVVYLYLGERILESDTQEALSGLGKDYSLFQPLYTNLLNTTRTALLEVLPIDGPTLVTQIDTWSKRNKTKSQSYFLDGDFESIIAYNIVLLHHILSKYGISAQNPLVTPIYPPFFQFCTQLLSSLENEPSSFYCAQLWNSLTFTPSDPKEDKFVLKNFLKISLLFQKLRLDQKKNQFEKNYEKLENQFARIDNEFSKARSFSLYQEKIDDIRNVEMRIFSNWTQTIIPFENRRALLIQAMRLLTRLVVFLDKSRFSHLQDAMMTTANVIENMLK